MHYCGRVRPSYSAGSVEGVLYLAVTVNADVDITYIRGTAARMLPVALL